MVATTSYRKAAAVTLFWLLLLCLAPLQSLLAVERHGDITLVRTIVADDIDDAEEIVLARLHAAPPQGETTADTVAFSLQWLQDTAGWFPMWKLYLTSDLGLLPAELSPGGAKTVELSSAAPASGHEYETALSYSPSLGALSIRVVDKTTQQVLYSKGFSVPTCDAAIYASDGASSPNYLPVGTVWSVGVYEQQRAFMEQSLFETRDAPAYIRLNADWSPIRVSWR